MAALTTQVLGNTGVIPTLVAASSSDTAEIGNGVNTFVVYRNTDSNAKTLTITSYGLTDAGDAIPAHVVTLPATTGEKWIMLRKPIYDPSDGTGRATITVTGTGGVTGVTVGVARVG